VHDQQGVLRAILAEVNNTFGQRHQYLLVAPDRQAINENSELECAKVFHVSPFFPVSGRYKFKLQRIGHTEHGINRDAIITVVLQTTDGGRRHTSHDG
jgi:DUF1365 family protein